MEDKFAISPQMYEECVLARAKNKMVEKLIQKALNEDDRYISSEYLAIILGLEKEKKDENQ